MASNSISDKAIAKLTAATLHDLDSVDVASSQEYVLFLIRGLPWFYRIPFRSAAIFAELSPLPFRLRRLSSLDDANCEQFVRTILGKAPFFPALHRLVRTFALMDCADRLTSAKLNRD
ncbi:MAG: hypothetical protein CMI31_06205 [Opitutae bacterium]|nr:hypothetical protein [Opitutae bacterium]|tara:strand:+ start:208 stop:561 length:354 start_codon:yes stop_codon:yes gene_type:complete